MTLDDQPLLRRVLIDEWELRRIWVLRKVLSSLSPVAAMELLLQKVREFPTNEQFLSSLQLKG